MPNVGRKTPIHPLHRGWLRDLLCAAGLRAKPRYRIRPKHQLVSRLMGGLVDRWIAVDIEFVASRPD